MSGIKTVITGIGSYIPDEMKSNRDFASHEFYGEDNKRIELPSEVIADKFKQITGIEERRYASKDVNASDLAVIASQRAIEDSGVDPETIDQIIFAHNFGNVKNETIQTDAMPALASRVKRALGTKNPNCIAYDILFGCPGWLQGLIQADAYIKSGMAKKCLVIGAETLSRVIDIYDRDSMIFSDGAGACIAEAKENTESGILSASVQSHCGVEVDYLFMGKSNLPGADPKVRYIKMRGRKVYEYAIKHVPAAMKDCLDKSGVDIHQLKKVFLHQANEKMDEGIIKKMYQLYGINELPEYIMPMSIHHLGNSSVATIPTLFDLVKKGKLEHHSLQKGDVVMFASVGAGMNINAVCYRI
ncbi:MAG: ketoacyl-ACP synthase III [Bacteroidota bacterium]|nr:ketoacyl-ACP synthase III [Bacteroidota bacterium]